MKPYKGKKLIVNVHLKTKKYPISRRRICTVARKVLASLKVSNAEISICLVNNNYIRKLNKRYKKKDSFTDVLAFPLGTAEGVKKKSVVGEIVISLDQTKMNAKRFSNSFIRELFLYVIHGILHILGYDDIKQSERYIMERKQKKLFNSVIDKSICKRL